ncbi:ComF family protein [Ravibacter arvi]
MGTKITSFWEDLVDLFFPRVCPGCGKPMAGSERHICTTCLLSLPWLHNHSLVGAEAAGKFAAFHEVMSVHPFFEYHTKGIVQALLKEIKYKGGSELSRFLGSHCGETWHVSGCPPKVDLVVPVPLHRRKLRQRGYNQSELFAEGLSGPLSTPVDGTLLRREVYTLSQTKKKKEERIAAMQHVFSVRAGVNLAGVGVLLVDDVLTTGATLEGCVEVLVQAGCREIHISTIAAAP